MADIDARLRDDGHVWQAQAEGIKYVGPEQQATQHRSPGSVFRRWPRLLPSALVVLTVVGIAALVAVSQHRHSPASVGGAASSSTVASEPIEVGLILNATEVLAGQQLGATVTLTNTTSAAIVMRLTCDGTAPIYVGLGNANVQFRRPPIPANACPPRSIRLRVGENRFPISIATTYQSCTTTANSSSSVSANGVPPCTDASGELPPLPAGSYLTNVYIDGLSVEVKMPTKQDVTVKG